MSFQIVRSVYRLRLHSNHRVHRRFLFGWIPDKIKYMVVPDKRTEKEKFLEEERKEKLKKMDDMIEQNVQINGVIGFLMKKILKKTGRAAVRDILDISVHSQEILNLAESKIINNSRVKKTYGDDVQVTGIAACKSDARMEMKEVETIEVSISIDGSKKSGIAKVVAYKRILEDLSVYSISVNDGHNEFDIDIDDTSESSSSVNSKTESRIIDVKAKD